MILSIILLKIIFIAKQQHMKEFCYMNEDDIPILLDFDGRFPFFPEDLEMLFETFSRSHDSQAVPLGRKSVHLTKFDGECHHALTYEVPPTRDPIITISLTLRWGKDQFVIDEFVAVLKSTFKNYLYFLSGLLGHSEIWIFVKRQTRIPPLSPTIPFSSRNINWNKEVRELKPEESLCISFLTNDFFDILVLSNPPKDYQQTKYSLFKFSAYSDQNLKLLDEKKYLAQVYPCVPSEFENKNLKIYVDPKTYFIKLEMSLSSLGRLITGYFLYDGTFKKSTVIDDMDFEPLEVISKPLTRWMVGCEIGILLYGHNIEKIEVPASPWEREYGFQLGFSLEKKVGDVVLQEYHQVLEDPYDSLYFNRLTRYPIAYRKKRKY